MPKVYKWKMELPNRLLLVTVSLLCCGHFGTYGRSTFEANPVDSVPSSPASPQSPDFETSPLESDPVSPASSQYPYINPLSARTTYPRTPIPSSATAVPSAAPSSKPFEVSSAVFSTNPFQLFSSPQSPVYTPLKSTPLRRSSTSELPSTQPAIIPPETTLPLALRTSAFPSIIRPTLALTTIPVNRAPSSDPQRCQLTFTNKFDDFKGTDYDRWSHRQNAQDQLAKFCGITTDRITNVAIEQSPSGNLVLVFTIEQGYPVYTADALQYLKNRLNSSYLQLASKPLTSPVEVYWTDSGPCPNDTCLNNGICDVTLASEYKCSCDAGYTGVLCQDNVLAVPVSYASRNNALFALLVLLAIPIAIAVVVGFVFGRRRQQKQQLKKDFDLRDVRTIGPRSMLSLPSEPGMRNQMYDTRSYSLAFSDTTFSKNVSSTTQDDIASNAAF